MAGAQSVTKKGTPATVMTTPSTVGSSDVESGLSRLRELEQRRLVLRQKRFSLEQRLYEFCGNVSDSPVIGGQRVENVSFEFYRYTGPLNDTLEPHGSPARLEFFDGQVYEGSVEYGLRAGHGRNEWKDGQLYVGEWKKNSRNGRGTHQWPDGRKACGTWKDGHLNGKVSKVLTSEWTRTGLSHALTISSLQVYFSWANGATFDGIVCKGKKHGRGTCEVCDRLLVSHHTTLNIELTRS